MNADNSFNLNPDYPDTAPAHWERVRKQVAVGNGSTEHKDQWHGRLVGKNGEIVCVTETYNHPEPVAQAINIARRSFPGWRENGSAIIVEDVDLRPGRKARA